MSIAPHGPARCAALYFPVRTPRLQSRTQLGALAMHSALACCAAPDLVAVCCAPATVRLWPTAPRSPAGLTILPRHPRACPAGPSVSSRDVLVDPGLDPRV